MTSSSPAPDLPPEVRFSAPTGVYERAVHGLWGLQRRCVRGIAGRQAPSPRRLEYEREGAVAGRLPEALVSDFVASLKRTEVKPIRQGDRTPGYRWSAGLSKVEDRLNAGHTYFRLDGRPMEVLARILGELDAPVADALGHPWRVVNVRCLETLPVAEAMGPNAWHGDGFPVPIVKVMLYLSPVGRETGTTEFARPDRSTWIVEGPPGTWLLFKNSELLHRGLAPRLAPRLAIELTIVPALSSGRVPVVPGLNAIYPEFPGSTVPGIRAILSPVGGLLRLLDAASPQRLVRSGQRGRKAMARAVKTARKRFQQWRKPRRGAKRPGGSKGLLPVLRKRWAGIAKTWPKAVRRSGHLAWLRVFAAANRLVRPRALNIGGGAEFAAFRWVNLDGATGAANPVAFEFTGTSTFPLADGTIDLAYSSHCLEHLDDATVSRVLREARRVLRPGGTLVIKVPHFDRAQECWRQNDLSFFDDGFWGTRRLREEWVRVGLTDSIDYRAAFIFCGFWTGAGTHFAGRGGAYHGPARVPLETLRGWFTSLTPHAMSAALTAYVRTHEPSYHFNHQNAWSADELRATVAAAGFRVESMDTDAVVAASAGVPGIAVMRDISQYCLARKDA